MNASFDILCRDLQALGVCPGDVLIVHSSLSSMGFVEGGAETVIAALRHVLGEEGTLLFPALSFRTSCVDSTFSYHETPACIGKIAETFRTMPGVVRSFHPTHSVCAVGKYAEELTCDHELDDTPLGEHSPYRKLPAYGGKILMLGCSARSNTFMHGMEEAADVPYVLRGYQAFTMTDKDGNTVVKNVRRHNFNRPEGALVQRYDRSVDVLQEGEVWTGRVHGADCVLMDAAALEKRALAKMQEDPYYFIDDPEGLLK